MRTAAVISMSHFPYWRHTIAKLNDIVDDYYISYDKHQGDPEILHDIENACQGKLAGVRITEEPWSCPQWREIGLRMLDDVPDDELPDIVLTPDQDEVYGDGIEDDLKRLWFSEKDALEFYYEPLMSSDGREQVVYPEKPHVKAFKYKRGLTFYPYHGDGKVAQYHRSIMQARSKIKHYASYTPLMAEKKRLRTEVKGVTLIGFGASAKQDMSAIGEVWTMNGGYDVLNPDAWARCTRIFEMHQREKLEARDKKNGTHHISRLNETGELRRIIMQKAHADIQGNEAYPLREIEHAFDEEDQWRGTPCYMLAMAIYEGYTHINMYGIDCCDWEHTLQREGILYWLGVAKGRGIKIGGCPTPLKRLKWLGKYAYDYAPEFCEKQRKALWMGHPVEIKYKDESRIVAGDAALAIEQSKYQ